MKTRILLALAVIMLTGFMLPTWAYAGTASPAPGADVTLAPPGVLTPAEVVALGGGADGAPVLVRGEAIGGALNGRDGGTWVNIAEAGTAVGLWGPTELIDRIDTFGNYAQRGSIVEARGTYNAACDQHGGDRDVHISELRVIEPGEPIERPLGLWQLFVALALFAAAGLLWLRYKRRLRQDF